MATYVSQRRGRDVPAVTAWRRRRDAETEPEPSQPSQANSTEDSQQDGQDSSSVGIMAPYGKASVTDSARKQSEQVGQAEIQKKAAELVRYALACEYSRTVIRKDDIRATVLDEKTSRVFGPVFNAAQKILHQTFGYHMVELRAKGADNAELARQAQFVLRAAASSANGLRPRGQQAVDDSSAAEGGPGTNQWVLRSALSPALIKELVSADEGLSKAYAETSSTSSFSSSARTRRAASETKAALDWSRADHQDGEMGLLYIILALILVNGRTITDSTLHMYLRRIHLQPHTTLPAALRGTGARGGPISSGSQSTQTQSRARAMQGTLEGFLTAMEKQGYLEKQRSDVALDFMDAAANQAQTQGRRRGRTSGGGGRANGADDETTMWEWRWGNRAEAEVGEKRIAELITLLFTDPSASQDGAQAAAEEDEETQAIDRERIVKRRKLLLTNIASVAGSQLVG